MTARLVTAGFPYDVVESWSESERHAHIIIVGELDGGDWDWRRMRWKKPKE